MGYVSFPEKPEVILKTTSTSSSVIPPTLETLKISTTTNVKKIENVQPLTVAVSSTIPPNHVRKEWIPGNLQPVIPSLHRLATSTANMFAHAQSMLSDMESKRCRDGVQSWDN